MVIEIKGVRPLLLPLVVALLAAEGMLWLLQFPDWWSSGALLHRPDYVISQSDGTWSIKSGHHQFFDPVGRRSLNLTIEEGGNRASGPRPESGETLLIVGDSYVMGYGVDDAESFPWKLQQQLQQKRIFNFGVGGYGTCHVLLKLRGIAGQIPNRPIEVIYLFNSFHEERNMGSPLSVYVPQDSGPPPYTCAGTIDEQGELQIDTVLIKPRWRLSRWLRSVALIEEAIRAVPVKLHVDKARQVTKALIGKMADELAAQKIAFKVALFEMREDPGEYKDYLLKKNIGLIDCSELVRRHSTEKLPDGHPNARLQALIADCIANAERAERLQAN